jgi:lambda repressor-like predicted transcriptional regulator
MSEYGVNKQDYLSLNYMRPEQIKAHLEERGTNLKAIATGLSVTPQCVSYVARGKSTSARIERAIAEAMDKPIHVVFPNRYSAPADYKELEMVSISRDELSEIRATLAKVTKIIDCLKAG